MQPLHRLGYNPRLAKAYTSLAKMAFKKNKFDDVKCYALNALRLFQAVNNTTGCREVQKLLDELNASNDSFVLVEKQEGAEYSMGDFK